MVSRNLDGTRKALDGDALRELGRPFTLEAVKYKPQTKPGRDGKAMATFYIDARLVAERLNHVVGPEGWEDDYKPLLPTGAEMATHYFPVECTLTVLGVVKTDVGVYQRNVPDNLAWKSAYSDSFKRVGVKFRVGAYLYAIPNLRAAYDEQSKRFSKDGEAWLDRAYLRWLANAEVNRFGDPLDHGDAVLPEEEAAGDEAIEFPAAASSTS